MAVGDITKQVSMIGEIAMSGDTSQVAQTIEKMVLITALAEIFMPAREIRARVNDDIGYLAGYLPPELGTAALQTFGVKHPHFGDHIPDTVSEALAAGAKIGKAYAIQKQTEAEQAKKLARQAKLGVAIPESGETVDDDTAAKVLAALKAERAEKMGLTGAATSMTAILAERDAKMPALKAAEAERLAKIDDAERIRQEHAAKIRAMEAEMKAQKQAMRDAELSRMLASSATAMAGGDPSKVTAEMISTSRYVDPALALRMAKEIITTPPELEEEEEDEMLASLIAGEEEEEEEEDEWGEEGDGTPETTQDRLDKLMAATEAKLMADAALPSGIPALGTKEDAATGDW